MTKSASAVALLALLGTAFVAPPAASADPLPALTVEQVSITAADTLTEIWPLTVTGLDPAASSVRISLAGQLLEPLPVIEDPAGVFTATGGIETWGLAGSNRHLLVAQCRDSAGTTDCGDDADISPLKIENPVPTHDLSPSGTEFAEPFDLTPHLAVTSGSPRLRITTDTGTPVFVDPETVTPVDTSALSEGAHQIFIAVCAADDSPCNAGPTVNFTVVRSVQGTLAVSVPAFSPNGAGLPDTIDFDYARLSDPWDAAEVEVRAAGTTPILFESTVPLPGAPDSGLSFTYDGKDGLGAFLPDGAYQARLVVTRTLDSGDVASSAYNQLFTVDSTALAPTTLTPSFTTFYPYVDGYRDSTKFTYTGREPYSQVDLMVWNSANPPLLIRTKPVLVAADRSWNGRNDAGARVPAGTYTVRIRVLDTLGNIGFSPAATVTVSNKLLVTVTKAVTVTPKASRVSGVTGVCSTRRTPSAHGWAGSTGYLSNTRCKTTFKASIVWTLNRVRLANAVTYRWVRLGWYGGPTKAATHDRAIATLYGTDAQAQGWYSSLDYMAAQYIPSVKGSRVVDGGYVSWGFQADRGNRYDVKSFTITYKADVLR